MRVPDNGIDWLDFALDLAGLSVGFLVTIGAVVLILGVLAK